MRISTLIALTVAATLTTVSSPSAFASSTEYKSQMVVGAGGRVSFIFVRTQPTEQPKQAEVKKARWVFRWGSPHGFGYVYER